MFTNFTTALNNAPLIITDGGIETRIQYETNIQLSSEIEAASLLFSESGRGALTKIYNSYLDVGQEYNLPIIIGTPTFRTNPHRVAATHFNLDEVIQESVKFHTELKKRRPQQTIFIAGVIGPKNDAFDPTQALSASEAKTYHKAQILAFEKTDIDFLFAATLPAVSEALGIAQAMAETQLPYVISFILNQQGQVMDGHSLDEAINFIDNHVSRKPLYYSLSCTHPSVPITALVQSQRKDRILEFKANASRKSTLELLELKQIDRGSPREFGEEMQQLHRQFKLKVLGGCCGTDQEHIAALAKAITINFTKERL